MNQKSIFIFRLLSFFVGLPLCIGALAYVLNQKGFFNISDIQIEIHGDETVAAQQQAYILPRVQGIETQLSSFKGQSLWAVNLKQISQLMTHQDWIASYQIKRIWPQSLTIEIQPHAIYYLYLLKNGQLMPVIETGESLALISPKEAPDVPLLRGEKVAEHIDIRKKAVDLLNGIPESEILNKKNISDVTYNEKEGFFITLIKNQIRIKMGEDQFAVKAQRVSRVLDYMNKKEVHGQMIDANLSKKVLVKIQK